MNMKHHQRSITIMGCLDELSQTLKHQKTLNNIYNHTCPEQMLPSTLDIHNHSPFAAKSKNILNFSHRCIQSDINNRTNKNRKLSDLHKNSYISQLSKKQRQMQIQNKRFVTKLLNIRSNLEALNQPKQQSAEKCMTKKMLENVMGDAIEINFNSLSPTTNKKFKSSSAINRHKDTIRIMSQNKNIKQRLFHAMSSSQYSQERLKKFNKTLTHISNMNRQNNAGGSRPLTEYLHERSKQQIITSNPGPRNTNKQIEEADKTFFLTKQLKIKTEGNQAEEKRKNSTFKRNQISQLLQNSIDYIQTNKYRTTFANKTKDSITNHKQSESIKKMRKAAMLHFRKVQKLKATQSKIWQVYNNKKKEQIHNKVVESVSPQIKSSQRDSILLTQLS